MKISEGRIRKLHSHLGEVRLRRSAEARVCAQRLPVVPRSGHCRMRAPRSEKVERQETGTGTEVVAERSLQRHEHS